ncbi:hypothetical protein A20C1_02599 [marine actinobacterium PHSC20C1]|nr:hypothetical protein A20C1_02599 [marine actinobacterium PHSC20C1]
MFAALGHLVMKPFMLIWLYLSPHSWRGLPVPEAGPPVRVDGPHMQSIVLCGSGVVVGYGVASHELALGGSIARSLAVMTGRGIEVATITSPRLTTLDAQSHLNARVLAGVDAVILSFGTFESLTFMPPKKWARNLTNLVDALLVNAPPRAQIFVISCNTPKMSNFVAAYQRHVFRIGAAYNAEIRALAHQRERVHHVEFEPEPEDPEAIEGRQSYRTWADAIAPSIANELSDPSANS